MDIKEKLKAAIRTALESAIADGAIPAGEIPEILLEVPPSEAFGDYASNIAMQSARVFKQNPRKIAEALTVRLQGDWIARVEIAGPGFLNFYLQRDVLYTTFAAQLARKETFGQLPAKDAVRTMVEYVSANPTGLLHVGHGRGAAAGSAIVNLLKAAGYPVYAEYYINDAGNQIDNLALSVNARYLELCGQTVDFPENGYRGADIIETAKRIYEKEGDAYLARCEEDRLAHFKEVALREKLDQLKVDLAHFEVRFDNWFSERVLHPDAVKSAVDALVANGNAYEADGAIWLKSTAYGDDKDRVIYRDNGVPTYLAADIAYHKDKFDRGFGRLINIWGADHHGYVTRVKAAVKGLDYDPEKLEILLLQMVSLYRGGELVKMSKRTGESITLEELIEEVGTDAARYFFLMRSLDSQLDFDLDLAKSRSNENPVYYIQYAHARIASIFRQAEEVGAKVGDTPNLTLLVDEQEVALIKKIGTYEEELEKAAADLAPQRIARFAYDTAALFHSFYNKCRIIGEADDIREARLALAMMTGLVIRKALAILGVSAPERM